jgi:large subunit ribosomal protein L7/L12
MRERRWSPEVQAIGDRLAGLTAANAAELRQYLEAVHGIQAVAPVVVERIKKPEPGPRLPPPPDEFKVLLAGFDAARKIAVIKTLRELLGLGIKEAKDFVEAAPRVVREGVPRQEAEKLKALLETAGANITVQ